MSVGVGMLLAKHFNLATAADSGLVCMPKPEMPLRSAVLFVWHVVIVALLHGPQVQHICEYS